MADPTIQTFCCHPINKTDSPVYVLMEFHSDLYNTVCVISSFIGIVGAIYQILPRRDKIGSHRLLEFSPVRGRHIIIWLAVADLMASMGVFIRSLLWIHYRLLVPALSDGITSVVFCAVSSAWIQYFYTATWFWTLCYALDVRRILKQQTGHTVFYHITSWLSPAVFTLIGLIILYFPDANCHNVDSLNGALTHILPNYCATFLPMAAIMIANPVLYCFSIRDVKLNASMRFGQFTRRERDTVDMIKMKFLFITLVFYICWIPNIICWVLLWSLWINLPRKVIISLWYIMAMMNPLQALMNTMVYQRWSGGNEEIYLSCRTCCESTENRQQIHRMSDVTPSPTGETTPLLQSHEDRLHNTRTSINGSSTDT